MYIVTTRVVMVRAAALFSPLPGLMPGSAERKVRVVYE